MCLSGDNYKVKYPRIRINNLKFIFTNNKLTILTTFSKLSWPLFSHKIGKHDFVRFLVKQTIYFHLLEQFYSIPSKEARGLLLRDEISCTCRLSDYQKVGNIGYIYNVFLIIINSCTIE